MMIQRSRQDGRKRIAVVGSGISGLSAAWLLGSEHDVCLYDHAARPGGHSNTVDVPVPGGSIPVDTGFIVYNDVTYPNLTAMFGHLDVPTSATEMTFAVSLNQGSIEYSGTDLAGIFAQKRNLFRPKFHGMLWDIWRFYRDAPADIGRIGSETLGAYLDSKGLGETFRDQHLYPMAAAIWSIPAGCVADYPAAAFLGFCDNHGLLKITRRPVWRTVKGGSRRYVDKLLAPLQPGLRLGCGVRQVRRDHGCVVVTDSSGHVDRFDHVVMAAHADQSLAMLADATPRERNILGAFRFNTNRAVLHSDAALMPKRRKVWSAWNYLTRHVGETGNAAVTYWMNRLQDIPQSPSLFVTLNPPVEPRADLVLREEIYEHPIFDSAALKAQADLWSLQGEGNTWFCGAWFGAGFHEDGLQAGLAVAEHLGNVRRPWTVANESGRIQVGPRRPAFASDLELLAS